MTAMQLHAIAVVESELTDRAEAPKQPADDVTPAVTLHRAEYDKLLDEPVRRRLREIRRTRECRKPHTVFIPGERVENDERALQNATPRFAAPELPSTGW